MIVKWIANKGREGDDRQTGKIDSAQTLKNACWMCIHSTVIEITSLRWITEIQRLGRALVSL